MTYNVMGPNSATLSESLASRHLRENKTSYIFRLS